MKSQRKRVRSDSGEGASCDFDIDEVVRRVMHRPEVEDAPAANAGTTTHRATGAMSKNLRRRGASSAQLLEEGEDEAVLSDVTKALAGFWSKLSKDEVESFWAGHDEAQGLDDGDDGEPDGTRQKKRSTKKKHRKTLSELREESRANLERQKAIEEARQAAATAEAARVASERSSLSDKRRKGKLFSDNADLWSD